MSTKLDKSLDELISSGPRGGGRRGGGSGGRGGGGRGRGRGRRQNGASNGGGSGGGSFVNPLDRTADDGDFGGGASGPERREGAARRARNSAAPYARNGGADGAWSHDMYDGSAGGSAGGRGGGRTGGVGETRMQAGQTVLVQNLDPEVDENDVHEIFQQMGGVVLKEVKLHYDKSGRFGGSSEVSFASRSDAEKVVEEFDGAEVDGRPMHLKLVGTFVSAPRVVRKTRPQPQQQQQSYNNGGDSWGDDRRPVRRGSFGNGGGGGGGNRRGGGGGSGRGGGARRGGGGRNNNNGGGGGGGGGAGRGGRGRRNEKASVSATDLDAELDAYHNARAAEAAPAAATGGADGQPTVASTPAATTE